MGFDDLVNKGKDALNSEQGEHTSDQAIQGAGDGFDRMTGGKFAEHTDRAQQHADGIVGQQDARSAQDAQDAQDKHDQQDQQGQQ